MTRFVIQQRASQACSGGDIYQNYSSDSSKHKDYLGWEKNTVIFCNLYSKATLLSIRECFDAHILQQEQNKMKQRSCLTKPAKPQILYHVQVSVAYHYKSCSWWVSPYSKKDWRKSILI